MSRGKAMNRRRSVQGGFTYLGILFAVALVGLALATAAEIWATTAQRQREAQLKWVGEQFRHAIGSYYESSPGSAKAYPPTLQDLVDDRRYLRLRRHLRRVYEDPMTGKSDWTLIAAPGGGIMGVASASSRRPVAGGGPQAAEPGPYEAYAQWQFTYVPERVEGAKK